MKSWNLLSQMTADNFHKLLPEVRQLPWAGRGGAGASRPCAGWKPSGWRSAGVEEM